MPIDPDFARDYRNAWVAFSESGMERGTRLQEQFAGDRPFVADLFQSPVADLFQGRRAETGRADTGEAMRRAGEIVQKSGIQLIRRFPTASGVAASFKYAGGRVEPTPSITFFVSKKLSRHKLGRDIIPRDIEGVSTDVIEAGVPTLQQAATPHTPGSRSRPAQPGMSVAHTRVTSGTFGCLVEDEDKKQYILSCAHVLSDASASVGDAILQPAPAHGGLGPHDQIGRFTSSVPLSSGACIADAAIAEVDPADVLPHVLGLGRPTGVRRLSRIGLSVQKSGDQTGVTHGIVVGIKATVGPLTINGISNVFFTDAIVTTGMSDGGDSGSLLMDNGRKGIGMLFGGLASGPQLIVSWYNPLESILSQLGVDLVI
jgi:hypothetical protein